MATKKTKGLGRGLDALLGADASALEKMGQPGRDEEPSSLPVSP
mgnify:CR=1 FL=1